MQAYFALVLHAHLPFVRHPEHEKSLEETWLFEALTETYLPLLLLLEQWKSEGINAPITLTLSPTLCAMLQDPLLCGRYARHLDELFELAEKEVHRTSWEPRFHRLAVFYHERFGRMRQYYESLGGDLIKAFRRLQDAGALEIITTAATHAVLPLLLDHPASVRAQVLVARDDYRRCFGRQPRGIWLPECAYAEGLEPVLKEAGLHWFITDTHGILQARPRPRFGVFAPVLTRSGIAAFGREPASARQVWSRHEGYPGDPRYRDFYRDIGFDLEAEYLRPHLPASDQRTFTGIKYYSITGEASNKRIYDRASALRAADEHAGHFLQARSSQLARAAEVLGRPPVAVAPYDAELFGHWWYEGPEFLDLFVRKAFYDQKVFAFTTPEAFLRSHPTHQVAAPAASSWGEAGYWRMWLNEKTEWIYPHLQRAQRQMSELVRTFGSEDETRRSSQPGEAPTSVLSSLRHRALQQAGRELLLAQASDWPFIVSTGTSPGYARNRLKSHLSRFHRLHQQIAAEAIDVEWLASIESLDPVFPDLRSDYWR